MDQEDENMKDDNINDNYDKNQDQNQKRHLKAKRNPKIYGQGHKLCQILP